MKLIKVDPWAKTVSPIETDSILALSGLDKLRTLQSLVTRGEGGLVELLVRVTPTMDLIGDEEALLKEDRMFFSFDGLVFSGIGIFVGVEETEEGKEWRGLNGDLFCIAEALRTKIGFIPQSMVKGHSDESFAEVFGVTGGEQ